MKKHFDTFIIIGILVVITLATIAAGFGYAAARAHRSTNTCTCDEQIVKVARTMEISHYSAAAIAQGRLRKSGLYEEADKIKVCPHCLEFELSK